MVDFNPIIPTLNVALVLLIGPLLGGLTTGLCGFGGTMIFQLVWRLSVAYLDVDMGAGDVETGHRRLLVVCACLTVSQYLVLATVALCRRVRQFRIRLVAVLAPGFALCVWVGTYLATRLSFDDTTSWFSAIAAAVSLWGVLTAHVLDTKSDDMRLRVITIKAVCARAGFHTEFEHIHTGSRKRSSSAASAAALGSSASAPARAAAATKATAVAAAEGGGSLPLRASECRLLPPPAPASGIGSVQGSPVSDRSPAAAATADAAAMPSTSAAQTDVLMCSLYESSYDTRSVSSASSYSDATPVASLRTSPPAPPVPHSAVAVAAAAAGTSSRALPLAPPLAVTLAARAASASVTAAASASVSAALLPPSHPGSLSRPGSVSELSGSRPRSSSVGSGPAGPAAAAALLTRRLPATADSGDAHTRAYAHAHADAHTTTDADCFTDADASADAVTETRAGAEAGGAGSPAPGVAIGVGAAAAGAAAAAATAAARPPRGSLARAQGAPAQVTGSPALGLRARVVASPGAGSGGGSGSGSSRRRRQPSFTLVRQGTGLGSLLRSQSLLSGQRNMNRHAQHQPPALPPARHHQHQQQQHQQQKGGAGAGAGFFALRGAGLNAGPGAGMGGPQRGQGPAGATPVAAAAAAAGGSKEPLLVAAGGYGSTVAAVGTRGGAGGGGGGGGGGGVGGGRLGGYLPPMRSDDGDLGDELGDGQGDRNVLVATLDHGDVGGHSGAGRGTEPDMDPGAYATATDDDDDDEGTAFQWDYDPYEEERQLQQTQGCCARGLRHLCSSRRTATGGLLAGAVGGLLNGTLGLGSSALAAYFGVLQLSGPALRDTAAVAYSLGSPSLLASRAVYGMFRADEWLLYLIGLPMVALGVAAGLALHGVLGGKTAVAVFQALILAGSVALVRPWLAGAFRRVMLGVYCFAATFATGVALWRWRRARALRREVELECQQLLKELGD